MKIYISGPMTGLPDLNLPAFDAAASMLRSKGYHVYSPADYERASAAFDARKGFRQYAEWICDSDAIWMLPGWEKSAGARAEHALAVVVGLSIVYDQWPSRSRP